MQCFISNNTHIYMLISLAVDRGRHLLFTLLNIKFIRYPVDVVDVVK